ncbi:MAG: hypothetical protein ACLPH3_09925 [Terracidiphilus sp.]
MDTKIINVYHEKSRKLLSSGLMIVDAALEPLKVLKVLMEGLGPDCKAGLWLTNFKGVPVARTLSPFDLIYLDSNYSVVHCVEISTEGEYEPFRGQPASALVLPAKTIASCKMHAGERLAFRAVDAPVIRPAAGSAPAAAPQASPSPHPSPSAQPPADRSSTPRFSNSAFPAPPPQAAGSPLDRFLGASARNSGVPASVATAATVAQEEAPRASNANPSGRLTKSAKSILGNSPVLRPSASGDSPAEALDGSQVSIVIASDQASYSASGAVQRASAASIPARVVSSSPPKSFNGPAQSAQESRSPNAVVSSGRLLRTVNLAPEMIPNVEPEIPIPDPQVEPASNLQEMQLPQPLISTPAVSPEPHPDPESHPEHPLAKIIPITAASAPVPQSAAAAVPLIPELPVVTPEIPATHAPFPRSEPFLPPSLPEPHRSTPVAPSPAASTAITVSAAALASARNSLPTVISRAPAIQKPAAQSPLPASLPPGSVNVKSAQPSVQQVAKATAPPAANQPPAVYPRTQIQPAKPKEDSLALRKAKPSWDVRLLYFLFPEFDPSRPPEIRIPRLDEKKEDISADEETPSRKLQLLCWLYPDLHLDQVKQKRSEERRAVRLPLPGLVAYFFTGGSPRPHPIKDISVTGFYMQTDERWMPGTIIRVTLQMVGGSGEGARETITVHSRVVRWGPDGGGFEFVLPGFLE